MVYRKIIAAAALLMCIVTFGGELGCSGHQSKTVRTEAVDVRDAGDDAGQPQPEAVKTTTTTTEKDDRSPGVIGSAAHLVWAAITLPFRLIGALF